MPKMTDAEVQKYAAETGTHALMGRVLQSKPCGCTVDGAGNLQSPIRIEFCKAHQKALGVIHDIYQLHQCKAHGTKRECVVCDTIRNAGIMV